MAASPRKYQKRVSALLFFCLFSFFGCVRVDAERQGPTPTRLVITRDTKGVNMQFQSVEGLRYTVYYQEPGMAPGSWKQLPEATEIPGTGELILVSDKSQTAFRRKYRIQSLVPVKKQN
ncbi:MAG: hypothetical protein ACO3N7_06680 [Kiritimatiellia bacterium]